MQPDKLNRFIFVRTIRLKPAKPALYAEFNPLFTLVERLADWIIFWGSVKSNYQNCPACLCWQGHSAFSDRTLVHDPDIHRQENKDSNMRKSIVTKLAVVLAVVSLVLFSGSAAYATWGGWSWSGWSSSSSSSSYGKSDKSDKSGKSDKSDKSGKSKGKSDKSKGKSDKSDKSNKSGKWGKSDKSDKSGKSGKSDKSGKSGKSGKGPGYPDHPVDPVIEGECTIYYAGQHTVAGSVCLTIIGDTVFVDYVMEGGWTLSNPHLWIGDTLASAPTAGNGNPIPGQFPFNADVSGVDDRYTFEIPVSSLNINADLLCTEDYALLVAAHGEVAKGGQHESAWAGETRFTKKGSWATYFGVAPECEDPEPEPDPQVCEIAEASANFSSTTASNLTLTLTDGVTTTFSVSTSGRTGPGVTAVSTAIIDPLLDFTLTDINLSVLRNGVVETTLGDYSADEPAPGEFKQGVRSFQAPSITTPDGAFTLRTQVELCEVGPQDPGPSA